MTISPQPRNAELISLVRPVLLRGVLSAVYGLVPVFVTNFSVPFMTLWIGAFWVLISLSMIAPLKALSASIGSKTLGLALVAPVSLLIGGVLIVLSGLWVHASVLFPGIVVSASLIVAGVGEFLAGRIFRPVFALARDWQITGALSVITGVVVALLLNNGTRGILGVSGGGLMAVAVVLILAALTFRFSSREVVD